MLCAAGGAEGGELKTCGQCKEEKDESEFYRRGRADDRLRSYCKICSHKLREEYYENNKERLREYSRRNGKENRERVYERRRLNSERVNELARSYYRKDIIKMKTRDKVRWAIDSGRLVRPETCSKCGEECKPNAHHEDYSKPLEVIWLCTKCHGKTYRKKDHLNEELQHG